MGNLSASLTLNLNEYLIGCISRGCIELWYGILYTQKKKFSQYLCFLIKSTILHISLSYFIHELYYCNFTCTCYCVTNNAFIRLYQPNFKMHDVHVLR